MLRRIVVWDQEQNRQIVLLTNHRKFCATNISDIFKDRWQIELFFKSLKQNSKVNTFAGTSENARYILIWTASIENGNLNYEKELFFRNQLKLYSLDTAIKIILNSSGFQKDFLMKYNNSKHQVQVTEFTNHPRLIPMRETFQLIKNIIKNRNWYDFGCGFGHSSAMLYEFGANHVIGYEPDLERVKKCPRLLTVTSRDHISCFDNILAYGVFEHIPSYQRQSILKSLWNRLNPGGHMVIADTPNRMIPYDPHTTHMLFIPWLPEKIARYLSERSSKRWNWGDWKSCGWKGIWLGDFIKLKCKTACSPISRRRHRLLSSIGLHPHLLDPWPVWVWQKIS